MTAMIQSLLRFIIGGVIVSAFVIVGDVLNPKSFAGLFGAAPSVALATLGLTIVADGLAYAGIEGRSMMAGAAAFFIYASLFRGAARWDSLRGIRISLLVTVVRALPSSRSASNPADISAVLSRLLALRKAALRGLVLTARACHRFPELRRSLEGPHGLQIRRVKPISLGRRWARLCRPRAQARGFEGPQGLRRELSSLSARPRELSHRRCTRCRLKRARC
jgi:hypothetical protein